jgi:hypothetical protein
MEIAASICIYTNDHITLHTIDGSRAVAVAERGQRV